MLSAADIQRLRDYQQFVIPAEREMPALREIEARIDAMAEGLPGDGGGADFRSTLSDLPASGCSDVEAMVSTLQSIQDPRVFAPAEWAALLAEVRAQVSERLAYDAELLRAYQRSVASGAPGLGESFVRWEDRPEPTIHWNRFQAALQRAR